LYKGMSFAIMFQVPALALFLSAYDASKHSLANLTQSANMSFFGLHSPETHLLSGMIAKAAGTVIWAPMNRIQSLASNSATGHAPLSLSEAYRLAKQVCQLEGVPGLWSGYNKSLSTLLPYTMIYFAAYEQFKMLARSITSSKASETTTRHDP
ncbi:mitochondrial carrier domain-containing protein, partial [Dissophora ornata]